ncbi:hypothetical protein PLICRDRAFT_53924 [Plicaturopsis crispa FD-325 SS-3]|nr:hypothetical protein PLICRDRAFT_53924 [Plicaturopsis crispa FD-325 SS-3]
MSAQQKALYLKSKHGVYEVGPKDIQKPGPGELLVKIFATALNPVDWKIQAYGYIVETYPAVLGGDASGTVEAIGEGVTGFAVGDRVVSQGWFTNEQATFQQYTVAPAEIVAKLPENISFNEAASLPQALATAAIGLYHSSGAGLEYPWEEAGRGKYAGQPIFIPGGSSSVGQFAIQLAALSGFSPIITTASPAHAAHLTSLGATHFIDRHLPAPSILSAALTAAGSAISVAYDAVALADTQQTAYDVLAPGGTLVVTQPPSVAEAEGKGVRVVGVVGNVNIPTARALGVSLYKRLGALLSEGAIKPNKVEVLPGGLAGIPAGLDRLKADKVSGLKLIAHPQETA